jgi:hypothetical protein
MKFFRKDSGLVMLQINDAQFSNGKFYYSTGEYCEADKWDKEKGFTKDAGSSLNVRLLSIRLKATDYIHLNRGTLSKEGLKKALDGTAPKEVAAVKQRSLIDEYTDYITSLRGKVQSTTYSSYYRSYMIFRDYLKLKGLDSLTADKFNYKQYQLYLHYIKNDIVHQRKKKSVVKGFDSNTVSKRLKHFKSFLQYLLKVKVNVDLELDEISYKELPGLKLMWSDSELTKLEHLDLRGAIDEARDLTLLQCSTGVRISDLFRIQYNIFNQKIQIETKKIAGNYITIPITDGIKRIMEKYNYNLPRMTEQRYRKFIKELYQKVNPEGTVQVRKNGTFKTIYVWQEISSHDNVRTFITLSAQRGMSIQDIARITGKTEKIILSNYLVRDQEIAEQSMMKAWSSPMRKAQ